MIQQFGQESSASAFGHRVKAVNFQIGLHKGPNQKSPDGSLMIGRVTLRLGADASFLITRIRGVECSQAIGRQKFSFDNLNDTFLLYGRKRTVRQGNRKNLIWTDTGVGFVRKKNSFW